MKIRLDNFVAEKENISRSRAQSLIKEGYVFVGGKVQDKPSFLVESDANITISQHDNYVSRGAYKLIKALDAFGVNVDGMTVLDMGASTGGFTQVLLERGATKVLSVDVGRGELDKSLALNERVVNMEGRDIRTITKNELEGVNMVVGDLSFISLTHILPHIKSLLGKMEMILLFKPQFECGKDIAKKFRGVIKDKAVHKKLLKEFLTELEVLDYTFSDLTYSPIKGGSGNIEYLMHINSKETNHFNIEKVVDEAFELV